MRITWSGSRDRLFASVRSEFKVLLRCQAWSTWTFRKHGNLLSVCDQSKMPFLWLVSQRPYYKMLELRAWKCFRNANMPPCGYPLLWNSTAQYPQCANKSPFPAREASRLQQLKLGLGRVRFVLWQGLWECLFLSRCQWQTFVSRSLCWKCEVGGARKLRGGDRLHGRHEGIVLWIGRFWSCASLAAKIARNILIASVCSIAEISGGCGVNEEGKKNMKRFALCRLFLLSHQKSGGTLKSNATLNHGCVTILKIYLSH